MATIAQPLTEQSNPPKQSPLTLTDGAITKVREIMATQELGDPFRRDALKKPHRLLEKYAHTNVA